MKDSKKLKIDMESEWKRLEAMNPSEMSEEDRADWENELVERMMGFKREFELEWDENFRNIIGKVLENEGRCPCKPSDAEDNICPCNETVEKLKMPGSCTCGLFVKYEDPLESCAGMLAELYDAAYGIDTLSGPVSKAVMKLRLQEEITSGVRSVAEDSRPGMYNKLDKYTPEEMLMAACMIDWARDEEPGLLLLHVDKKFGEKGNRVLRDLIEMDIILFERVAVVNLGEMLRLRVMGSDPALAEHIVEGKVTVIDFSAEWCGPCQKMGAALDAMAKESDDLAVFKIDVDKDGELAGKYGISAVPFAVVFGRDRKPLEAIGGFPGEEALRETIEAARA